MPNTQGLTSPRHAKHPRFDRIAEPIRAWLDTMTATPAIARTFDALLLVIIAIAVIGTLTACKPTEDIPGRDVSPSAGVVIPGPPPVPTATTWEQVGA